MPDYLPALFRYCFKISRSLTGISELSTYVSVAGVGTCCMPFEFRTNMY